jgi:hypothetical protein
VGVRPRGILRAAVVGADVAMSPRWRAMLALAAEAITGAQVCRWREWSKEKPRRCAGLRRSGAVGTTRIFAQKAQ